MRRLADIQYPPEASLRAELQALAAVFGGEVRPGCYSIAYVEQDESVSRRRQISIIEPTPGAGPFVACGGWSIARFGDDGTPRAYFRPVSVVVRKASGTPITLPDVHKPGFDVYKGGLPRQVGGCYDTVIFAQMPPPSTAGGEVWPASSALGGYPWPAPVFLGDGETLVLETDYALDLADDDVLISRQWGISGFHTDAATIERLQRVIGELRIFTASWRMLAGGVNDIETNLLPRELVLHDVVPPLRSPNNVPGEPHRFAQDAGVVSLDTWRIGPFFSDDASSRVGPLSLSCGTQVLVDTREDRSAAHGAIGAALTSHLICSTR